MKSGYEEDPAVRVEPALRSGEIGPGTRKECPYAEISN